MEENLKNYKKAYILEVHRNFLILMTSDGAFLRYSKLNSSMYEIGDEIIIESSELENNGLCSYFNKPDKNFVLEESFKSLKYKNKFRLLRGIAVGVAAVVILTFGIYFGINYLNKTGYLPSFNLSFIASAKDKAVSEQSLASMSAENITSGTVASQSTGTEMLGAENISIKEDANETGSADKIAEDTSNGEKIQLKESFNLSPVNSKIFGKEIIVLDESGENVIVQNQNDYIENMQKQPVLYEGFYNMNTLNTDFVVDYPDIQIGYKVNEDINKLLTFNFIAIKQKQLFNGNINAVLNDENLTNTRTFSMIFKNFKYGQQRTEIIILENIEKGFKIIIYGYFNELN